MRAAVRLLGFLGCLVFRLLKLRKFLEFLNSWLLRLLELLGLLLLRRRFGCGCFALGLHRAAVRCVYPRLPRLAVGIPLMLEVKETYMEDNSTCR